MTRLFFKFNSYKEFMKYLKEDRKNKKILKATADFNFWIVSSVVCVQCHRFFRAFGRSERSPFADYGDTFLFEIAQTLTDDLGVGNLQ